jgi:hypothetical protein
MREPGSGMGETDTAASNRIPETASRQLDRKRKTGKWQWDRKPQTGTDPAADRNSASANARFKRRRRGPVPGISI